MALTRKESRYELNRDQLAELLDGQPKYRVEQLWKGLYEDGLPIEEILSLIHI